MDNSNQYWLFIVLYASTGCVNAELCPENFQHYGSACYNVSIATNLTISSSRRYCKDMGRNAKITDVLDQEENQAIFQMVVSLVDGQKFAPVLIGMKAIVPIIGSGYGVRYYWLENSNNRSMPVRYVNWGELQPQGLPPYYSGCVLMSNDSRWRDSHCNMLQYRTVCKISPAGSSLSSSTERPVASIYCPEDWVQRESHCYYRGNDSAPLTWYEAEQACQVKGLHSALQASLVSIHSREEAEFIYDNFIKDQSFWVGMNISDEDKLERWSDGSQIIYHSWARDTAFDPEPKDDPRRRCVKHYLRKPGGPYEGWRVTSCDESALYVCKGQELQTSTTGDSGTRTSGLPVVWMVAISLGWLAVLCLHGVSIIRNRQKKQSKLDQSINVTKPKEC